MLAIFPQFNVVISSNYTTFVSRSIVKKIRKYGRVSSHVLSEITLQETWHWIALPRIFFSIFHCLQKRFFTSTCFQRIILRLCFLYQLRVGFRIISNSKTEWLAADLISRREFFFRVVISVKHKRRSNNSSLATCRSTIKVSFYDNILCHYKLKKKLKMNFCISIQMTGFM